MTAATAAAAASRPARRLRSVLALATSQRLRFAAIVGAGMGAMALAMALLFNSIESALADLMAEMPDAIIAMVGGVDMATESGWLNGELFSLTAPIAILAVVILSSAHALPGEEERHTLGLLLSNPVSRSRIVTEKAAAMGIQLVLAVLLTFAGTLAGILIAGMDIPLSNVVGAAAHLTSLGLFFGALALLIGAMTGRRRVTTMATIGVAVAAYSVANFLPLSERLASWAELSAWHYYLSADPLANGIDPGHVVVLCSLAALCVAGAAYVFQRRDVA